MKKLALLLFLVSCASTTAQEQTIKHYQDLDMLRRERRRTLACVHSACSFDTKLEECLQKIDCACKDIQ